MKIFLEKDKINQLSKEGLLTYIALRKFYINDMNNYYISINQLTYLITNKYPLNNKINKILKGGMDELIEKQIIKLIQKVNKDYIVDLSDLSFDSSIKNFIMCTDQELNKLLNINHQNKLNILKYFINLINDIDNRIKSINNKKEIKKILINHKSIENLSVDLDFSIRTIIRYNKILQDNKLLYIAKSNDLIVNEDNELMETIPNAYGRYCDKEFIDNYMKKYKKENKSVKFKKMNLEKVNKNRRLAQEYNAIYYNGKEYSYNKMYEIYKYVCEQNKKYCDMNIKYHTNMYNSKFRDTSIFSDFDFYNEDERS